MMRMNIFKTVGVTILTLTITCFSFGQRKDAEGCKDSPLFARMNGYYIERCVENMNAVSFVTGAEDKKTEAEGKVLTITYESTNPDAKMPSGYEVIKYYETII